MSVEKIERPARGIHQTDIIIHQVLWYEIRGFTQGN